MELPRALEPWAPYLDVFPHEVGLALGPLVQRIALALGPLAHRSGLEGFEPDGFEGLSRRGVYERLLLSELAVADEYPEEFARRAAMGEHLFYRLAMRAPARSHMSIALFDAGPNQLGAPRIAHIAALVSLARRADAAGARFGWCVLQRPDLPIFSEVTATNVLRLLDLRSSREATDADVTAWRERLREWADLDDLWLVGGARLGRLQAAHGVSRLEVADPCDPDARRLDLTVSARSSSPRQIALELPDDRACARLLRDPFEATRGATRGVATRLAPRSNLVFDASGTKLFARGERGVISYPVPNSPRAGVGKPKVHPAHSAGEVVAAGRAFRKTFVASLQGNLIVLGGPGGAYGIPPRGHYALLGSAGSVVPSPTLGSVHVVQSGSSEPNDALVFVPSGTLVRLSRNVEHMKTVDGLFIAGTATIAATGVLAIATRYSRAVFVGRQKSDEPLRIVSVGSTVTVEDAMVDGVEPTAALFGFGGALNHHTYGICALRFGATRWRILTAQGPRDHEISTRTVAGVVKHPGRDGVAGLLTIDDGDRTIGFETQGSRKVLVTASSPIMSATACSATPVIAYATEAGDVVVWSLAEGVELCRFAAGGIR